MPSEGVAQFVLRGLAEPDVAIGSGPVCAEVNGRGSCFARLLKSSRARGNIGADVMSLSKVNI